MCATAEKGGRRKVKQINSLQELPLEWTCARKIGKVSSIQAGEPTISFQVPWGHGAHMHWGSATTKTMPFSVTTIVYLRAVIMNIVSTILLVEVEP